MTYRPLRGLTPRPEPAAQDSSMGDDEREAGAMAERVRNVERRLDALEIALGRIQSDTMNVRNSERRLDGHDIVIGKIQSDQVNARTASVADHGRQTIIVILVVVWPVIVTGIALIVELSTR